MVDSWASPMPDFDKVEIYFGVNLNGQAHLIIYLPM